MQIQQTICLIREVRVLRHLTTNAEKTDTHRLRQQPKARRWAIVAGVDFLSP